MAGETDHGDRVDAPPGLRTVLGRMHGELLDLGRCADGLQIAISSLVSTSPSSLDLDAQVRLQAADALSQRLERLADLASALEASLPDGWPTAADPRPGDDLTGALARLPGAGGPSAARALQDEGDCELF